MCLVKATPVTQINQTQHRKLTESKKHEMKGLNYLSLVTKSCLGREGLKHPSDKKNKRIIIKCNDGSKYITYYVNSKTFREPLKGVDELAGDFQLVHGIV